MASLDLGFNFVAWTGANLTLTNATWKNNVSGIYKESTSRSGLISFTPTTAFNSVTTLETGKLYLFRVTTAFPLPDAQATVTPATATPGGTDTISLAGPAGETTTEFEETYTATAAATLTSAFQTGAGTVELYRNGAWGALPTGQLPASTPFRVRVLHPNNAAFTATLTLTYA